MHDIEQAAGALFRAVGLDWVADDDPAPDAVLRSYIDGQRALVTEWDGTPVAYLVHSVVDDAWHVGQVSVHPDHGRRGLGRELMEQLAQRGRRQGAKALTLTTFRDVEWNAPYYARCGFEVMPEHEWGPELREIRRREGAAGLDREPRVCMRRTLQDTGR